MRSNVEKKDAKCGGIVTSELMLRQYKCNARLILSTVSSKLSADLSKNRGTRYAKKARNYDLTSRNSFSCLREKTIIERLRG